MTTTIRSDRLVVTNSTGTNSTASQSVLFIPFHSQGNRSNDEKITNQRAAFKQKKFVLTNEIEYILLSSDKGGQSSNLRKLVKLVF